MAVFSCVSTFTFKQVQVNQSVSCRKTDKGELWNNYRWQGGGGGERSEKKMGVGFKVRLITHGGDRLTSLFQVLVNLGQ